MLRDDNLWLQMFVNAASPVAQMAECALVQELERNLGLETTIHSHFHMHMLVDHRHP